MKATPENFEKIFLKNLFKRLIDSYIVDDDNLKTILQNNGIVIRGPEYDEQILQVSENLSELFFQNFSKEQQMKEILENSYKLKKWITEKMKNFE